MAKKDTAKIFLLISIGFGVLGIGDMPITCGLLFGRVYRRTSIRRSSS